MRSPSTSRRLGWNAAIALVAAACSTTAVRPTLGSETIPPTITTAAPTESSTTQPITIAATPLTGEIRYEVVASNPHDTNAFTQGLEFVGDDLYESTGLVGLSDLRITDSMTGEVIREAALNPLLFGEGMTVRDGLIYQLTYTSGTLLIADATNLDPVETEIKYEGEGWGLCTSTMESDRPFVMSNGTAALTIRDPATFEIRKVVPVVAEDGSPVAKLNELECLGTHVLANIWQSDEIVSINMASGRVEGRLNLSDLVPEGLDSSEAVLNGIAYRATTGTYFVTGKLWPVMYELQLTSG